MSRDVKMRRRHHAAIVRISPDFPDEAADIEELRKFMVDRLITLRTDLHAANAEIDRLVSILDALGIDYS
jgi:hypothetical protein